MDSITYRGLTMTVLQSLGWERTPLFDASNTTYECTRVRGSVIVSYNPGAESFKGNAIVAPVPTPGEMPVQTDVAIRRFLEQPRGVLSVTSAGGITFLKSPASSRICDVRNGPFVRVNTIAEIPGERLWKIHLEFETYINEHPKSAGSSMPPLFLSNRWYGFDDTNWQHLRTRTYQGVCTVRGDILQAQAAGQKLIDFFRNQFCAFTVPVGFQRENIKVTVTPDGNTAHYTVTDVEQIFNKSQNCPAIRIEVCDSSWLWLGSAMRALGQMGGAGGLAARALALGFYGASAGASLNLNNSAAAAIALTLQTSEMAASALVGNLPKGYKNVVIRCWGNQRTPRSSLVRYAMAVASTRMGGIDFLITSSKEFLISQDSQNFVQLSYTANWGLDVPAAAVGGPGAATFSIANIADEDAPAIDVFARSVMVPTTTAAGGFTHTQNLIANPPFPADSGTRGTASLNRAGNATGTLQTLVTQALEGFDATPAAVP